MPAGATPDHALLKLAAIGTLAGAFSGLFGVGGGTIIVPLLILWFAYGERLATGTSLAAIVGIALVGAYRQHGYGNVRLREALVIAALSPLGVLVGVLVANNVSERVLQLSFA